MPSHLSQERAAELADIAKKIATPGKGILAADESTGTIAKRFSAIGLENTVENRAAYRELLFTSPKIGDYISGVILYEETLFQKGPTTKKMMVDLLKEANVIPGIKVDMGVVTLPGTDGETATQGLDGLAVRCQKYYEAGARFAKWRAVLVIGCDCKKPKPSSLSIQETAHTLARYAAICQENRLVPIVEPEILTDGNHSIEVCAEKTEIVLNAVMHALNQHNVLLEGCLLKPNMVTPGVSHSEYTERNKDLNKLAQKIAFYTIRTLKRSIPPALVSINFLSGGQSEEEATLNLNAMNSKGQQKCPWTLSFSYGRALQSSCLKAWQGKSENVKQAQDAFLKRAKANSEAQLGTYKGCSDASAQQSLHEEKYVY